MGAVEPALSSRQTPTAVNRTDVPVIAASFGLHALLLLLLPLVPHDPPRVPARRAVDTVQVAFSTPPKPLPPPPPPPPPELKVGAEAPLAGQGRPVRRAPETRVRETRRPAFVDKPAPTPARPARARPAARPAAVPPVAVPVQKTPTKSADRVATAAPPGERDGSPTSAGTRPRPDATDTGGGAPGRESTRERPGGDRNGTGTGDGTQGTGTTPSRGSGAGVSIAGLGNRQPIRQPLPSDPQVTVTLTAEIAVSPDGSVRFVRWVRRGDPGLQRQAEGSLSRWRFAALPAGAPQQEQRGQITFRFVAN